MWISLTPLLLLLSPCQGVKTSCEIPEVEEGHDTTLTCIFSDDVRKLQQDFKVHFYRDNTTAVHDTVLDCVWLHNNPECRVNDCCRYDKNVNNTLQVLVPKVTANNVGRYVCFVLPASQDSYQFCKFNLKIKEIQLVEESSNTLGALAVLVIIPVAIVIVIVIIFIRKCKNDKDDSTANNNQDTENSSVSEVDSLLPQPVDEARKQTDKNETDSCERTVKDKHDQGAVADADTTEDISNNENTMQLHNNNVHSDHSQKRLEGNDAHTATNESVSPKQSDAPLPTSGDGIADSRPQVTRNPPTVTTETGAKSHPLMQPQITKQRKGPGKMFKFSVNRPNKVLIEQYNIQTEDETANKSKIKLKAQRSSKTRKNLAQSKGGNSSKPKDSGSTRMNLESSHQAAFSVSLSSSQSTRSANDNDDDTRATKEASQTFGGKELKTENETKDKQIDVHKYTAEYSSNDAIPKEGKMKGNARKEAMTKEKAAKDRQIAKVRAEEKEENATEKAVKEEKLVVLESEEGQEEQSKIKETEDDAYDVEHAGETDPFLATKGSNVQVNPATRSQSTPNTIIIMSELASHPDTPEAASEVQDVRNTEGTQNQTLQEVDKVNSPVQTKPNEDKESNRKAANGRGCTVS